LDELPRDRPIATVCASGYRSSVAASMLRAAGFRDVSAVADGVPAWRRHGHAVERGAPRDAAAAPGATPNDGHGHSHEAPAQPLADEPAAAQRH
jgi:3-mercaptopyruvate sulfurtransferase SseA